MKCQAKIQDGLGGHWKCSEDATKEITFETFAPHLQKVVKKVRCLCNEHSARLTSNHRYKIKHCGKKTTIITKELSLQ